MCVVPEYLFLELIYIYCRRSEIKMLNAKTVLWAVVGLAIVYTCFSNVRYYYKIASTAEIIQPALDSLDIELLQMRKPIVIAERIVDHQQLLDATFKYQYWYCIKFIATPQAPTACAALYTMLINNKDDAVHVDIYHPPSGGVIRIRLHNKQTLILPTHWKFACVHAFVDVWELYDVTHHFMKYFT